MVRLVRHSQRKRGATDRPHLRSMAPVLDPTDEGRGASFAASPTLPLRLLIFLSRLLRMTYGLTLVPEEEPTQVEIRSRGDVHLRIRAFDH